MAVRALQRVVWASWPLTKQHKVPQWDTGEEAAETTPPVPSGENKGIWQTAHSRRDRPQGAVSEARRDVPQEFRTGNRSPRKQQVEQMKLHSPSSTSPYTLLSSNPD